MAASGLSCGRWALEVLGSVVGPLGLSCSMAGGILVPQPGTESEFPGLNPNPCVGTWILNHWTTRKVPVYFYCFFKSYLYILDNSSLSDMYFADIFCQSVVCLLILLRPCFAEQKFGILMKFQLINDSDFVSKKVTTIPKMIYLWYLPEIL